MNICICTQFFKEISREGISFHSSLIIRWKKDRFERESSMFSHTGCMHQKSKCQVICFIDERASVNIFLSFFFFSTSGFDPVQD